MRTLLFSLAALSLRAQIVFPPDLSISRLELVQTIQDEAQTVPLIAGKATGARAFVRQQQRPEALVGGVTVFLRGFRDGVEIAGSPLRAVNGSISAVLQPDRGNAAHSLDFILPVEWTNPGRLELRAELRLPPNTPEGPADNNNLRREVEFVAPDAAELRVFWIPVCLGAGPCAPSGYQHQGLAERLLPLADGSVRYEDVPAPAVNWTGGVGTEAQSQALLNLMRKWRMFLEDSSLRAGYVVGWLPRGSNAFDVMARSVAERAGWIVEQSTGIANQRLLLQQLVQNPLEGGCDAAIGDPGYDVVGGRVVASGRNRALARCDQSQGTPWISAFDGQTLRIGRAGSAGEPADGWILSGVVRRDGTGRLDPAYPIRTAFPAPASSETAEACLVLTVGGNERTHCFLPFSEAAEEAAFAVRLPGAVTGARLLSNGVEVAAVAAAGQSPAVSVTFAQQGALQWTASDPLGRPMKYAVFYTVDDGANWLPVAIDLSEPRLAVELEALLPGVPRFRVVASAGLDVGEAVSEPMEGARAPRLVLPESTLNFGNATTGQIAERGIAVQNSGNAPLELFPVTAPSDAFRFTMPTPLRVRAGTERSINLRYRPRIPGQESSEFALATNDTESAQVTIGLRASSFERLVPNALISPRVLDFGQVAVGQTRELPYAVRNEGTAPLNVTSFSTLNARFAAVSPSGSFSIAPGDERSLTARFAPLAGGPQTGTLNVATNDPSNPTLRLDLRGTGQQVFAPSIEVSPVRVEFGTLSLGQTSSILPVTVRNGGTGPLSLISLTLSNPAFAVIAPANLPVTVAPGAQQVISLRFAPSVVGTQTATLVIESSDATRGRVSVDLTGTATQQTTSVAPAISYVAPVTVRPVPAGYNIRFNVTVYGVNFAPGAKVLWNGSERPTEVLSSNQVRGSLGPEDVAVIRESEITVVNPPPGGGTSGRYPVLVAGQAGSGATGQIHEISLTNCPAVTASVAVTNRLGLGITALNSSNVTCLEDGQRVECSVRLANGNNGGRGLSVVMVLHASASVLDRLKNVRDIGTIQTLGNRFVNAVDDSTLLQVTYMENGVRVSPSTLEFKDGSNKGALQDAVNSITTTVPNGSGTALYDAIEDALDRLATQTTRRKAIVLFTASENTFDTRGPRNVNQLLQRVQSAGVPLYLIPVGDGIQNQSLISALNQFASDSGGRVMIDRGSTIAEEVGRLAHEVDNMHLVDFPATRRDGLPHRFQINFNVSDGQFSASKVYQGCPAR